MKSRKLFAALLCALLCLLMAGVALAEEESPVIASGNCGVSSGKVTLTWKLTEDGTLTISGTGRMTDYYDPSYHSSNIAPWYSYQANVKNVIIESGVTDIGENAFIGCSNLTSITIPNSVTNIDKYAFNSCSSLTSVTIPGSLASIGLRAFECCSRLTSFTILNGVGSIDEYAFYGCSRLASITIQGGVRSIGRSAFERCSSLKDVYYQGSITDWLNIDFLGPSSNPCDNGANLYINDNKVTDVIIPDGVTSIGSYAFSGCSSLTSITIPDSVTSIGSYAFDGCSSLTSISIPDGVTSIGSFAFDGCSSLTSIILPDGVTSIGSYAFKGCSSLTSISIPDGVTRIYDYTFRDCSSLTSITIPDGVTSISERAFEECRSVKYVYYLGNITDWLNIIFSTYNSNPCYYGASLYINGNKVTDINIPDGVTIIGNYAFVNCRSLTNINIPDSVVSIGRNAFFNCSSLKNIFIPSSVLTISASSSSDSPFYYCSSSLIIWTDAKEKQSGWDNYWNYSRTVQYGKTREEYEFWSTCDKTAENIIIPDGVTSIPEEAFYNCNNLTSITIPDSVTSIGSYAFYGCSNLNDVYYEGSIADWLNIVFSGSRSNPCYNGANLYINGNKVTNIIIPDGVTNIGGYAFSGCSSLTSINIPDSVTSIDNYAFCGCSNLTSITIPNSVTTIGDFAFSGCRSLMNITIPDSVTSIGDYAFRRCNSLTSITIPDGVTSIGEYAFSECSSLSRISIPNSVMSIGTYAFEGCSSLTNITIPDRVKSIGSHMFYNCSNLMSIIIPDSVTSIGSSSFYNCYNLNLYLPDNISSIGSNALYNVGRIYCKPHTVTSASIVKYGNKYYVPGNDDFRLTESDGRVKVYSYGGNRYSAAIPDGINEWIYSSTISAVRLPATLCETDVFTLSTNSVTVPEGVTAMGTLSLSGVQKIFIPASVMDMSEVNVTDGSSPTVYCTMDSEAELWAIVNGYDIVYTDGTGWEDTCVLTYVGKEIRLDVGEEYTLSASDFSIQPLPAGDLSVTLTGNGNVSVSGMTLKANVSGNSDIIATFSGSTVTVPVHVYEGATGFVLTSKKLAGAGESFTVTLSDALPADISGKFTWRQDNGTPVTDTVHIHTFTAPSQPGSTVITVTAPGGYTKSVTVTVAGSISAPYAGGNSRAAVTGSFIDICVDVDGVTYRNASELYGEVTVPDTAAGIIELTEDGRVHVIGSGRTAFSVTGLDGKKVNFIVVASEPGDILTLPAGTLSIGEEAFAGTAAQKAVLPSGCVSIGSRAFAGSAVQIVNVPASVTSIADDAFSGCSVTVYCPAGSYAESWCAAHSVNCVAE